MGPTKLRELLEDVPARIRGDAGITVTGVAYRSDQVRPGDVFFCIPGFVHDGHDFATDAVAKGAAALVVGRELEGVDVPQAVSTDVRRALALASARLYEHPSRRMRVVGVTGTNGKTTSTYLVESILRAAGRVTGLMGTVETRVAGESRPAGRTTPESADLQRTLSEMAGSGVTDVAMEVSSHAIDLHRVDGVRFAVAAFTNLTQDHLDYHATLEEYLSVKRRLFTELDVGERVVNVDDPYGAGIAADLGVAWSVGRDPGAAVRATDVGLSASGSDFELVTPSGAARVSLPLAAEYNVDNALVAAGCCLALGVTLEAVVEGLGNAPQVPGRLERVDAGQPFTVLVDYAHTPDSLEKAASALKGVTPGRVITVFGCGGDRDPAKRPLMGLAAGRASDHVVLTSDNPRSEDPVGIMLQAEDGLRELGTPYEVEVDRRRAIARALALAGPGDAVLIAGKGHEGYQQFADRRVPFDDRIVAREELERLC